MIVRKLEDEAKTSRRVVSPSSKSTRLLLAEDEMGFSLNVTVLKPGVEVRMCYQNHFEAVYCVAGRGSIEDEASGVVHPIGCVCNILYWQQFANSLPNCHFNRFEPQFQVVRIANLAPHINK